MKTKMILAVAVCMLAMFTAYSQAPLHDSLHVKIMKNENGVMTNIDTTVAASQHDQLLVWLSAQGIELPPPPPPPGMEGDSMRKVMMLIEVDDSMAPGQFERHVMPPPGAPLPPPPPGKFGEPVPPPHPGDVMIIINDSTGQKQECRKTVIINHVPPPPPGGNAKMKVVAPKQNELVVYPNPSKGNFTVDITSPGKEKGTLEVIDANGKTIYSEQVIGTDAKISKQIDLGKNAKGIYSVKFSKAGKVIVEKIVVE